MEVGMKKMNLAENRMYLEDLEVTNGYDIEKDIETKHQDCTKIFIQPPVIQREASEILTLLTKKNYILITLVEISFLDLLF